MKKPGVHSDILSTQGRLRSDWIGAKTDLSSLVVGFVMLQLLTHASVKVLKF